MIPPIPRWAEDAERRNGQEGAPFRGRRSTRSRLKRWGVDVAMFGEPFAPREPTKDIVLHDLVNNVYKKLVVQATTPSA